MLCSLLSVLPFNLKPITWGYSKWLLKIFYLSEAGSRRATWFAKWSSPSAKNVYNWAEKQCQIVCGILVNLFFCVKSSDLKVVNQPVKLTWTFCSWAVEVSSLRVTNPFVFVATIASNVLIQIRPGHVARKECSIFTFSQTKLPLTKFKDKLSL